MGRGGPFGRGEGSRKGEYLALRLERDKIKGERKYAQPERHQPEEAPTHRAQRFALHNNFIWLRPKLFRIDGIKSGAAGAKLESTHLRCSDIIFFISYFMLVSYSYTRIPGIQGKKNSPRTFSCSNACFY